MRILLTGGSGLIGFSLAVELLKLGYHVCFLTRRQAQIKETLSSKILLKFQQDNHPYASLKYIESAVSFTDDLSIYPDFSSLDAVINLAGEPIFQQFWSFERKQKLYQSRVQLTQQLVEQLIPHQSSLKCVISASATGFYGDRGEELLTEKEPGGQGFLAQLCQDWEDATHALTTRCCLIRTGMVLDEKGGALAAMLPLYRLGLGGKLGNGKQYWSWISLADAVQAILFLLHKDACQGVFNLVSPHSITNAEFNRQLGRQLKRPHFASVPSWGLKFILGERAELLLQSQRVYPEKLLQQGFQFQFPQLVKLLSKITN